MVTLVPLWYQVKEGLGYPVTRTLKTTSSPSTTSRLEGNSLMVGTGMRGGIGEWREGRRGGGRGSRGRGLNEGREGIGNTEGLRKEEGWERENGKERGERKGRV